MWISWAPHSRQRSPWSLGWINTYLGNWFTHNQAPHPQFQQPKMQLPNNVAQMGAPLRPQLPARANPNPNNKEVQQFENSNMVAYSISHPSCNELHL